MKKGRFILLAVCVLSLTLVVGIFIGRNMRTNSTLLIENEVLQSTVPLMEKADTDNRLDMNNASKVQIMELPGIGEVLAERIIAYRTAHGPFSSIDDLRNVEGIGEKKLIQIENLIKVGG